MKQETKKAKKTFVFKNGKDKVSKIIADALEDLSVDGKLTPKEVVEAARNPKHPLHSQFDWDNTVAGEKWRIQQARLLINQVEVVISVDGEETTRNKYVNVELANGENGNRSYITVEKALSKECYRQQVLDTALAEAEYWQTKYQIYQELSQIFQSIEVTKKKLKGGKN